MTEKVLPFTGATTADLDADDILEANKNVYESFVLVGYTKNGEERMVTTTGDAAMIIWLLERAKKIVLESADPNDDEDWV